MAPHRRWAIIYLDQFLFSVSFACFYRTFLYGYDESDSRRYRHADWFMYTAASLTDNGRNLLICADPYKAR